MTRIARIPGEGIDADLVETRCDDCGNRWCICAEEPVDSMGRPIPVPVRVLSEDNFERAERAIRFAIEHGHLAEGEAP